MGANPFQTTLNAEQHRTVILKRANIVREAMASIRGGTTAQRVDAVYDAVKTKAGSSSPTSTSTRPNWRKPPM